MRNIYILVGNIASGKSTWSKEHVKKSKEPTLIICKDNLREMVTGEYIFDPKLYEPVIDDFVDALIFSSIKNFDLIIDETHMNKITRKQTIDKIVDVIENWNYNWDDSNNVRINFVICPDGSAERRFKTNSRGYTLETCQEVYDRKQDVFEMPTIDEIPDGMLGEIIYNKRG